MSESTGIAAVAAAWLNERGIPAQAGWSGEACIPMTAPTVVVTVREYAALPGGFAHYLGERYNGTTAAWEECYGRKAELSLGLDLYAPETGSEGELQALFEKLAAALALEAPEGLQVNSLTSGPTVWEEKQRRLKREVTAKCTAWLMAVRAEDEEFLDFELRGGWKI